MRCESDGCIAEARFHPVLTCCAAGVAPSVLSPARLMVGVKLCASHVGEFDVRGFYDLNAVRIGAALRIGLNGLEPDLATLGVDREPLGGTMGRLYARHKAGAAGSA